MSQKEECGTCHDLNRCDGKISWEALVVGADGGCATCRILRDGICGLREDKSTPHMVGLVVDMSLFAYTHDEDGNPTNEVYEFFTNPGQPVTCQAIGPARHVSANSSSDECISLAKRWLNGCLSGHEACKRKGVPTLPTRVIDVGTCEEDAKLFVNSSAKEAEYAALSHCWGLAQPIMLTKASLESMQRRIVFSDSSKTFKDAVNITRRLGIQYLWIDSLCILQDKDDLSDWEAEAPKMSDIYNSATVTISAASSTDTSGGLFPDAVDRKEKHRVIELSSVSPSGEPEVVHVRARTVDHFDISETAHASVPRENPQLRTRGWVLQEDLLSPRMLYFGKEELTWICSTYTRCECRLRPAPPIPHPFRTESSTIEKTEEHTAFLDLQWLPIIMEYTRRNLTVPSDRVFALSGLANYMETTTTDTYFCGLWYEDMAFQMLWYVDRVDCPEGVQARLPQPYAQSWSWMSVPGPISYYERYPAGNTPSHPAIRSQDAIEPLLRVLNVGRMPLDWDNLVGKVQACPATIFAHVLRVEYDRETREWKPLDAVVEDFDTANLRVNIDTLEDNEILNNGGPSNYVFILAGRWVGHGLTYIPMEAVCILARSMPPEASDLVDKAAKLQLEVLGGKEEDSPQDMTLPELSKSYERIGLVRRAGSIDKWKQSVDMEVVYLF